MAILISVISKVVQAIEQQGQPSQVISQATASQPEPQAPHQEESKEATKENDIPQIYAGEIQLIGVDEKTAACIMAIVSEETEMDLSEMVFKKIKAL